MEVRKMRERTEQQQQHERQAVLNEKRRLLRELALRSAVVRSYFADGDHRRPKTCCCFDRHRAEPDPLTLTPFYRQHSLRGGPTAGGDAQYAFPMLPASAHR